jgi:hypothetical protein
VFGSREADARNGFDGLPPGLSLVNYHPYQQQQGEANKNSNGTAHFDDRSESAWDQNTEKVINNGQTYSSNPRIKDPFFKIQLLN